MKSVLTPLDVNDVTSVPRKIHYLLLLQFVVCSGVLFLLRVSVANGLHS